MWPELLEIANISLLTEPLPIRYGNQDYRVRKYLSAQSATNTRQLHEEIVRMRLYYQVTSLATASD